MDLARFWHCGASSASVASAAALLARVSALAGLRGAKASRTERCADERVARGMAAVGGERGGEGKRAGVEPGCAPFC